MEMLARINPGYYLIAGAILCDVLSTFMSAKGNGLEDIKACGMSVREDPNDVTGNDAHFACHVFIPEE